MPSFGKAVVELRVAQIEDEAFEGSDVCRLQPSPGSTTFSIPVGLL